MPFKEEFEPVHEAIQAAIKDADLNPLRADDIFSTQAGMEKILRGIAGAEVVVADMSERNANVFYEAGIAHMAKENVVLLTRDRGDFPFDLQHIDHIIYEPSEKGLRDLTEQLSQVIRNLPTEPAFELRSAGITDLSMAEIRRDLRRLLQTCEQEWLNSVIPEQIELFRQNFADHSQFSDHESLIKKAISDIQPAFLLPWQPIENMGFEIIAQEKDTAIRNMVESLERAYLLPQKWRGPDAPYVAGHGPLLALRTWVLWGAYALDSENWKAVDILLHDRVNYGYDRSGPISRPIIDVPSFFYPKAAGGNISTAIGSVYAQSDSFSERHFGDAETMKVFISFWMFATDMAMDASDSWMLSTWGFSPRDRFERVVARLENEPEYAQHFTRHVAHSEPASLNQNWQNGLRKRLLDRKRLGSGYWGWDPPKLPQRFAE